MVSVGIVTICDNTNYGNRLQNYALQEVLREVGVDRVETIPNNPGTESRTLLAKRAAIALSKHPYRTARQNVLRASQRLLHPTPRTTSAPNPDLKEFTQSRIREYPHTFESLSNPTRLAGEFSHFIVGSDQVWNPGFRHVQPIDFLTFARPEQRIAYAASFGMAELPQYVRATYQRNLSEFKSISVREQSGADIIHSLVGRTPPVVLDPTLLVEADLWHNLAEVPSSLKQKDYALAILLGGFRHGEEAAARSRLASEGIELINLLEDSILMHSTPEAYLGAVASARLVLTDSFHAAALSVALHTRPIVRYRHEQDDRMETLFSHTGVRFQGDLGNLDLTTPAWDAVDERLHHRRINARLFLTQSLG